MVVSDEAQHGYKRPSKYLSVPPGLQAKSVLYGIILSHS